MAPIRKRPPQPVRDTGYSARYRRICVLYKFKLYETQSFLCCLKKDMGNGMPDTKLPISKLLSSACLCEMHMFCIGASAFRAPSLTSSSNLRKNTTEVVALLNLRLPPKTQHSPTLRRPVIFAPWPWVSGMERQDHYCSLCLGRSIITRK